METQDEIAVVLANWNGAAFISRCLDALFEQTHPPFEVVVVDNGSTDGSQDLIRRQYPKVKLIEQQVNEGFCRSYNLGIRNTVCPYVLILNTDVFLDRDFLFEVLKAINYCSDIGSVACKLFRDGTDTIDNVGLYLQPWLRVTNSRNVSKPEFVFSASGSAMFCRRTMLEDICLFGDYFDETFFLYWEDMDLSWRARLRGWRCLYSPRAIATHIGSASQSGRIRTLHKAPLVQRHIWKNRYLILTKNAPVEVLIVLFPWLFLGECFHWLIICLCRPYRLPIFFLAHFDYLRLLRSVLKKRRMVQNGRQIGLREVLNIFERF